MPATASFLGSNLWAYPTVPGTYDLSTFLAVNQDCPADSVILVGSAWFSNGIPGLPMGPSATPPLVDDAGVSYFANGGAGSVDVNFGETAAELTMLFWLGVRFNVLSAGQRIKFRRQTVTIGSPAPTYPARGFAVDFAYLWQGANSVGTFGGSGLAFQSSGSVAVSSAAHTIPTVGTYDLIGVGVAGLANIGENVGDSPPVYVDHPVGAIGNLNWAEDAPFTRDQTLSWDNPWDWIINTQGHWNGPGVYLSKATVTRASPTSQVYTATLTDPTSPPETNAWLGAFMYPSSLSPVTPSLAGVWNLQSVFGKYHHAYAKNDVLHYAQADSYRPPFVLDSNVAVLPSGAKDSEPKMVQRGNGDILLLFTRLTGSTPAVLETLSRDEGTTWRDPVVAFSGAKHGDITIDRTTGTVFRAAYVSGQIKGTLQNAGDLTQSAVFTLVDKAGTPLAPDDDCFHVAAAGDGSRRWLLVMVKGGNVVDYQSTDDGRTWAQVN